MKKSERSRSLTAVAPFRPGSYVIGAKRAPVVRADRDRILKVISESSRETNPQSMEEYVKDIQSAIAFYRAEEDAATYWKKARATKRLTELFKQVDDFLKTLTELNEPLRWLIRSHEQPTKNIPVSSLNRMIIELCGFHNVLALAIAQVKGWPKGRPPEYERRNLACHLAKALKAMGIKPTLARNGIYANSMKAVMDIVGGKLRAKSKADGRDVMDLMRHGLSLLRRESPEGEFPLL